MLIYKRVERLSNSDDLILDLGAKGGSHLTETAGTVVAIDLEFSKSTDLSEVEYAYADGRQLPFEDDIYDFVVLNQVIEHVDDRAVLFKQVNRILKPGGTALFSFPNRFFPNKPHGLPRYLSALPKPLGLRLGRYILSDDDYDYYRDGLFPLSPIGARLGLKKYFDSTTYVTVSESMQSKEIYGSQFAPRLFVSLLPVLSFVTQFVVFQRLFEFIWGHVAYECVKKSSSTFSQGTSKRQ